MIIGITGTDGAGKGAVVEYLQTKGYTHYSVRSLIVAEIQKRGLVVHRPHMKLVGNAMRAEHGGAVMVQTASETAKEARVTDFVIESIRTVEEVLLLHEYEGLLLAVDADQRVRYERIRGRGSETDQITFDEFVEQDDAESKSENTAEQNKGAVMQMADHTIMNDGTLPELQTKIEAWLKTLPNNP
jgi:dephospho-CoA kinase